MKLRPIVAGPQSSTQRLSHFLDILLKPLCPLLDSYIRDDMDFLNHIPSTVPEHSILTSFDVTSLYTNIPHDLGIDAVKFWVEKHRGEIDDRFKTEFILEALKIVLEGNTFYFDGNTYQQKKGTAMGTKVAPSYANLVMGYLEEKLHREVYDHFGEAFQIYIKNQWKRYLDDCLIFWTKSHEELETFHNILNSLNPSIKFTIDSSTSKLSFLDILIILEKGEITTDIFYKATDTHQYLNFYSCHPSHTKRNIPYCMARRICTIVTKDEIRTVRLQELEDFLLQQNYPEKLVDDGIKKAKELNIAQLRTPKG